jgi:hypothetical protein
LDAAVKIKTEPALDLDVDFANAPDGGLATQSTSVNIVPKTEPMEQVVFTVAEVKSEPELQIDETADQGPSDSG